MKGKRISEAVGKKGVVGLPYLRQYLAKREREVLEGRLMDVVDVRVRSNDVEAIFADYLEYAFKSGKSHERAQYAIQKLERTFRCVNDFTEDKVEEYMQTRVTEGVSPTTIDRGLAVLSAAYKRAVEKRILPNRPFRIKRFNKDKESQKDDFLSLEDMRALLKTSEKFSYFHTFIMCSYYLGYRKSEILQIRWEDINFTTGHVHLDKTKTTPKKPLLNSELQSYLLDLQDNNRIKTHELREELERLKREHKVLIRNDMHRRNEKAQRAVSNKLKEVSSEFVMSIAGKPIGRNNARTWKRHLALAGITKAFTPHDLCHTFASHYLMSGGTTHELLEYGRWDDMRSLLRYTHIEKARLQRKLNRMSLENSQQFENVG